MTSSARVMRTAQVAWERSATVTPTPVLPDTRTKASASTQPWVKWASPSSVHRGYARIGPPQAVAASKRSQAVRTGH